MNNRAKGIIKWLNTFYGKDIVQDEKYIHSDPFGSVHFDEDTVFNKFVYDKEYNYLSIHYDIIDDIKRYFQVDKNEAMEIIKNWYSNKFNVIIDNAGDWS